MDVQKKRVGPWFKRILIGIIVLALAAAGILWYIFNEKFGDTAEAKADYTVDALAMIGEFIKSDSLANKKYTEKIVIVNGTVSEVERADTTVNIKMVDASNGSYIIFAFQQQHLAEAKMIKQGDKVAIKGSCSGGNYSRILDAEFITFKRCALIK